jgi:tetratricopeptide (TPR) repeat protein
MQIVETIDASHREMARFRSSNEAGYIQISGALRRYITMLHRDYDTERVSIAASFSAPLAARKTIFSVPFPRNPDFVGRETQIQEVEKRFAEPASGKSPFVAIHGLGGIGKSQVALEIAYRWKESFPKQSILWIHASTKDRFNQSFRDILALLGIPENPDIDVERLVGNWLEDESNGKWLMIVDNVDDEDVVFDRTRGAPAKSTIVPCIPKAAHGSVLFTTRYKKIAIKTADDVVSLIEMTEEEANLLLKQTLKDEYKETEDYKPLIEELGFIPLAISHAAAFMRENDIGLSEYMELYRDSEEERVELLGGDQELEDNEDSGVPKPVLATWTISFGYLKKDTSAGTLAPSFLSVMSFMDRQDIPKSLLASFDKKASKVQLAKAIGSLKTMSLISESDHQTFSMHRLVQLSMRRWLKQEGQDQEFATKALCLLAEVFPDGSFQTWKECSTLVVHAESVLRLVTNADDILARIKLLTNVATFQSNRGEYIAAQAKFEEVVALRNETSGAEDIETLKATDALVLVLRKRAKYQEAADLAQKVLEKKDRLLGKDHLETLNTAQILARLQGDRGSHHDAADQNRIIWEARNRILGSQHLDTLESAGYLVLELWELGKFDEAEKLAREVLTARAKILGEEHPLTLEIAGTLGFILEVEGKYQEAEELKQKILDVREKVLGKEHPDFSESLHDMGWILHQQGRYSEAGDYYDHALELKLRILGDNHPSTLTTMCNIPVFLCDQGKYEDAEVASRRIIKKFEEIQGMEHPQTLDACGGLTVILRHQGKLDEAAEAAKRSITGREKVIGKDHPWTQPTKVQHGWITTLQGNQVEGEQEIRKAVSSLEASVGKEHPYVLIGILCLSKNLVLQNKNLNEAEELARRALAGRTLLLGAEHQYTLKCMWQIAMVLLKKGEVKEAEGMCRKALDGLQKALGSENPDVTKCDRDLTVIIQEIGRKGLDDLNTDVEVEGAVVMDLYDVKDEDESLKHD